MKYHYFVVTKKRREKYYSYPEIIAEGNNLLHAFGNTKDIINISIFDTKKEANRIVDMWNETYKANGEYLLDDKEYMADPLNY